MTHVHKNEVANSQLTLCMLLPEFYGIGNFLQL